MAMKSFLQALHQRISLTSYISQKVKLTRQGRLIKGLCPFHEEKTPSFTVNEERGFYHCFGCGAHGDIIDFVREHEHFSFQEAIAFLAKEAGLSLPGHREDPSYDGSIALIEKVCSWFQTHLQTCSQAQSYLAKRGFSKDQQEDFRLGWSPGYGLMRESITWGFKESHLQEAGLVHQGRELFSNRLIFPIFNHKNQVIAFGGRLLEEKLYAPKYLNSPETSLFTKGACLYHLPRAKGRVLLVEGYSDVIALSSHYRAFSPLGTAVTPAQLSLLWQKESEPVICFDGDEAGKKAMKKVALMALPSLEPGKTLFFVTLPKGEDPHSFCVQYGIEAFHTLVSQAIPLSHYLWNHTMKKDMLPEHKAKAKEEWKEWVATIRHRGVRCAYEQFSLSSRRKRPSLSPLELYEKLLLGSVILFPFLKEKFYDCLCRMTLPATSPWLPFYHSLLSLEEGDVSHFFKNYLGSQWEDFVLSVRRHLPRDISHVEQWWLDIFNAYQGTLHKKEEILSLKNDLFTHPDAWDRLRILTQL